MSRLIDADALDKGIRDWYCAPERCNSYNGVMCRACSIDDALNALDSAPTIDAEPVRHGYIKIQVINPYDGEDCYCSVCGHWSLLPDYKWCPYCGAKMDGGCEDG